MRPHPQDTNRSLLGENFVHDTVLNIDAARICAGKIAHQFFKGRGILKGVVGKNREQVLRFLFKAACRKFLCIFHGMLGINHFPTHQLSTFELFAKGSAMPTLMDSRMPGTASRYRVS